MKKAIFSLTCLFLSAAFVLAQDPDWHRVPAEDLRGNRGEIAKTLHSTQDETIMLQIWQRPETDEEVLYLKMLAAKRLGLYGTKAAVPILVPRLDNERDGFFARYALETIPGAEVDAALCEALKTIERPGALAGVLTTLGVRGNPASAEAVKAFLTHQNTDVRRAAGYAYALTAGDSGIPFFTNRELDPLLVDSGFLFAEQFEQKGNSAQAGQIYTALALVNAKEFQKMAAIYRTALAYGLSGPGPSVSGVNLLPIQLRSDTRRPFDIGLKVGRELPADADATVAKVLIVAIALETDPWRKSKLVRALGDRLDAESKAAALPVIAKLVPSGDVPVRVAAIDALRNIGNPSIVPVLIEAATQTEEKSVSDAAQKTLAELPGAEIDTAIVALLEGNTPAVRVAAINLIAERRIFSATPALLKLLNDSDASVSTAAAPALGQISGIEDLPLLLDLLRNATSEPETQRLLVVLKSAGTRFSQDAAATEVAKILEGSSTALKTHLLDLLKEIAGTKSLEIVESYAWGADAEMRNSATRILGEWRSPADLDRLAAACLKLAKESEEYKIRGLRGYIRLARQFNMPDDRRLSMSKEFFDIAERDEDKVLIFDVFSRVNSIASLEASISYIDNEAFRERAADSAVTVAERLQGRNQRVAEAMRKVIEVSTSAPVKERAQRVLNRQ